MKLQETLTYDDVLLVPHYSDIESRQEVNIGNELCENIHLELPIISSPMDTVTGATMAKAMASAGGLGIIYRYNTIEEQCKEVQKAWDSDEAYRPRVGAAIGVTGNFEERARALKDAGADVICIDVAHGHHALVERAIKTLKDIFGDKAHIMAGNVATAEGYLSLSRWGADSIRCNIGGGSICSTRTQTGHGVPGLHTVFDCATYRRKWGKGAKIIADGGIKTSGDIVKALAAGADFVMLGSLLAGTDQTPGDIMESGSRWIKKKYKVYRGMASKEAQFDWKGAHSSNEGISTTIPYKGDVLKVLEDLENGIRSGFSYSGARNIDELREQAQFIRQTFAGVVESSTHILGKKK